MLCGSKFTDLLISFQLKGIEAAHFIVLFYGLMWHTAETLFSLCREALQNDTW